MTEFDYRECSCCRETFRQWDKAWPSKKCDLCYSSCPFSGAWCNKGVSDDEFESYRSKILEGM